MTKRETILEAVVAALAGTAGVSTRIYRSREDAFTRAESPSLLVDWITDPCTRVAVGRLSWSLLFRVSVISRADVPDQSADSTIADVHSKIMSNATLSSLLTDLVPVTADLHTVEADKTLGVIAMQFKASYLTAENTIS